MQKEALNRSCLNFIVEMKVSKVIWAKARLVASHLVNHIPSSVLIGVIPYSIVFSSHSLFSLPTKIFGCTCFVFDVRSHVTKLDPNSLKCAFLGYSCTQKGYRFFLPQILVVI